MTSFLDNPAVSDSHAVESPDARAGRLDAITNPGAVKINVKGAFIVDDEPRSKSPDTDGVHYESKDIRLPHHKGVVSHVAVDVSSPDPASCPPHCDLCDRNFWVRNFCDRDD